MKRKGVFPYNYLTNVKVLQEMMLPPKEMFYNDLTSKHITQEEYEFAGEVWRIFECTCIKHYLEIYLLTNCLLLCDVFLKILGKIACNSIILILVITTVHHILPWMLFCSLAK